MQRANAARNTTARSNMCTVQRAAHCADLARCAFDHSDFTL